MANGLGGVSSVFSLTRAELSNYNVEAAIGFRK